MFFKNNKITASVYGLGKVGLPLVAAWLRAGAKVIGVDIHPDLVEELNRGVVSYPEEREVEDTIIKAVEAGNFTATTDGVQASRDSDVKIIIVPTKVDMETKQVDLTALQDAAKKISLGLKRGDMVIVESTVPPLTTEKIVKPILEKGSGLKAEKDFGLAYSPERVMVGHALKDIEENYPKVVGGVGERSTLVACKLYENIAKKGVIAVSNSTVAETAKVFEGIYRDVNIALANELSRLCSALGIDFMEVRKAANSQPYCHLHLPGIGVGGLCIPVYPYFALKVASEKGVELSLTRTGRLINEKAPVTAVETALNALKEVSPSLEPKKCAILGLAFRGNVADTRLSPTYDIIDELKMHGFEVKVHDPLIREDPVLESKNTPLLNDLRAVVRDVSLIILSTDHLTYKKHGLKTIVSDAPRPVVFLDGRNLFVEEDVPPGVYYISISGRRVKNV